MRVTRGVWKAGMPRASTWPRARQHLILAAMLTTNLLHPTQHLRWWDRRGIDLPYLNASPHARFIRLLQFYFRLVALQDNLHTTLVRHSLRRFMTWQFKPLNFSCPAEVSLPSFRTQVGRRCLLTCCFDLYPGLHFSHSPFCSGLNATSSALWNALPPRLLSGPRRDLCPTMPRLRHRLRCRRGNTRASSSRGWHSPSISSDSSSPTDSFERPRVRRHSSNMRNRTSPASRRPRPGSSRSPAAPLPAAPLHSPSSAIFHFQSNSNKPLIIATVTVSFKEVAETTPAPPPSSIPNEAVLSPSPQFTFITGTDEAREAGAGSSGH